MSLAGAEAAEARHKASSTTGFYNLKAGPTVWSFSSGLIFEYNDNITYRETDPESDFVLTPRVAAHSVWPVSDKNSIGLDVGMGYQFYTDHSELNRIIIDPGSELSFDLYAGDFRGGRSITAWRRAYRTRESVIAAALVIATERWPAVSVGSYPSFLADGPEVEVVLKSADDAALAEAAAWIERELDRVT